MARERLVEDGAVGLVLDQRGRQRFAHATALIKANCGKRAHCINRFRYRNPDAGAAQIGDKGERVIAESGHPQG
jgi:hypothetical protein